MKLYAGRVVGTANLGATRTSKLVAAPAWNLKKSRKPIGLARFAVVSLAAASLMSLNVSPGDRAEDNVERTLKRKACLVEKNDWTDGERTG